MITTIVISKDKPAQLHLLLESLQKNGGTLFSVTVIYEHSNDHIGLGYERVQDFFYLKNRRGVNFPIRWWKKRGANLVDNIIQASYDNHDLVCLFNDENILFGRPCSYSKIKSLFATHSLASLSLRLGNNTVIQNPYERASYFAEIPEEGEFIEDTFLIWDASEVKRYTNFAIPFSTNGHIYHKNLLYNALFGLDIKTVEDFEEQTQAALHSGAFNGRVPPNMACLEYSVVIRNSLKKVTDDDNNALGINDDTINLRYLEGKTIDYDFFDFKGISKPYEEFIARFSDG